MISIQRLLIANRGEIACRIMRTAKRLGIETIAIYSDADHDALHVKNADHAIHIGPSPASESYLVIERIIDAAISSGSHAIHPGYGFLSENASFAKACAAAGILFVGPSERAIELMGHKAQAKRIMIEAGVACVAGYQGEDQSTKTLLREAEGIGFPLMIKAAAGGGGRGMRLVHEAKQLTAAVDQARSEAINAFGSGDLILERAIVRPRHVEVQVFGDSHGNLVYLGERDCSVQRRNQKVIEEAPCPVMTPERRSRIGVAAVSAARAVDYVGAGTVEFLLDEDGSFYFLEMNTRLQVEHPVTEAVTGLDLVELQLRVAAGEELGFGQDQVQVKGHAIEARLYAEDPRNDFLPSTGRVQRWQAPRGAGIRVDAGIESGSDVTPFYDPLLAKVIAKGDDREDARRRLVRSLSASLLAGPTTNRDFLIDALGREPFVRGEATTAFIEEEYGQAGFRMAPTLADLSLAAVAHYRFRSEFALSESPGVNTELMNWSSGLDLESVTLYRFGEDLLSFTVHPTGSGSYSVLVGEGSKFEFTVLSFDDQEMRVERGHEGQTIALYEHPDKHTLTLATPLVEFTIEDLSKAEASTQAGGDGLVVSPMHGQLLEISVKEGNEVTVGQPLALIEAMKMQHEIVAQVTGRVIAIHVECNSQVALNRVLMEIEPTERSVGGRTP